MRTVQVLVLAALSSLSVVSAQTTGTPTVTDASPGTVATADSSHKTSTVYYAPVTVLVPDACAARTAFGYISMETVYSNFEEAAAMTPWSITSFEATPTDAPMTEDYNTSPYLQVAVFLTEQPYPMQPNGEEQAWTRVCYDPRNEPCPATAPIGGPSAIPCMPTFEGARVTFPSTVPQPTGAGEALKAPTRIASVFGVGVVALALLI